MSERSPSDNIEEVRGSAAAIKAQEAGEQATVFSAWGRLNLALISTLPAGTRRARAATRRIRRHR